MAIKNKFYVESISFENKITKLYIQEKEYSSKNNINIIYDLVLSCKNILITYFDSDGIEYEKFRYKHK